MSELTAFLDARRAVVEEGGEKWEHEGEDIHVDAKATRGADYQQEYLEFAGRLMRAKSAAPAQKAEMLEGAEMDEDEQFEEVGQLEDEETMQAAFAEPQEDMRETLEAEELGDNCIEEIQEMMPVGEGEGVAGGEEGRYDDVERDPQGRPLYVDGWTAVLDETYDAYYFYHEETETTQWEPPECMQAAGWTLGEDEGEGAAAQGEEVAAAAAAAPLSQTEEVKPEGEVQQANAPNNKKNDEQRQKLKAQLKELFFQTVQQYTLGVDIVKIGTNGKKYLRKVKLMGRFLVISSKSVPKSLHISRINDIKCGRESEDFSRHCKGLHDPSKWPAEELCCVLQVKERALSLLFPTVEARDAFVFMLRVLRRQAYIAAQKAPGS
uniref:WW domain-containing protein n=1 Tax=Chromera velia CCMP2878 TaxID=1169474 RepID=A0A0G4FY65_9ALVE|eukprot:Cvel_3899.t1-p1 / transcript=Cvel_3899.t1 / gene=Cvel_3899 / organism=Chromera_velia_CCMP2878 / gene_product=hypothetical protein / transcript_product=hypothetical protein / location=Cvel_scaffold165:40268-42479(+) / protein_length=378 / sequence_SO=supercontig / SO=protein_coding / is_pseudo=false